MSINSHIQLPNGILKHFRDQSDAEKKVWYLNISDKTIGKKPSGRLGTSKGYFSKGIEAYWNSTIESPIGKLNEQVLSFCSGTINHIDFKADDINTIKNYLKAAIVRSNPGLNAFKLATPNQQELSIQKLHDESSIMGMSAVDDVFEKLNINNMIATILVNRTNRFLVVPRNCFYCVSRNGYTNIVMPITPLCALLLMPKAQLNDSDGNYGVIQEDEQVLRLNKHALICERDFNGEFVASNSRKELEYLIPYI